MFVQHCLVFKNCIIAVFMGDVNIDTQEKDLSYDIMDYGLLLKTAGFRIPLPEVLLEHAVNTGSITVCHIGAGNYIGEPIMTITLDTKSLAEAKGGYLYANKAMKQKEVAITEAVTVAN